MRRTRRSTASAALLGLLLTTTLVTFITSVAAARTWTDASGKHKIDAEFVKVDGDKVQLRKPDGTLLSISLSNLSVVDKQHVQELLARPPKDDQDSTDTKEDSTTPDNPPAEAGESRDPPTDGPEKSADAQADADDEATADDGAGKIRVHVLIAEGIGRKKEDAQQNAVRNALRQAISVLVDPTELVKNDEWIEENLLKATDSLLSKIEKIDEKKQSGLYLTKIEAHVIQSDLVAELEKANVPLTATDIHQKFSKVVALAGPEENEELASNPWASRGKEHRARLARQGGGTRESELAVDAGLTWLAKHQNGNGSWSFNHTPGDRCSGFPDPGQKRTKMGATGLVLCAFLGAGHTHKQAGPYKKSVYAGLKYLLSHMNAKTGMLYERDGEAHTHMYCHGIAACAIIEAYGMTKDKKLSKPAKLAIRYISRAQGGDGGWRYRPNEPGDTSVVGWQVMALKSAKLAGLKIPDHIYPATMKFLDSTQMDGGARYKYMPSTELGDSHATSAIGLLSRIYMGWSPDQPGLGAGVAGISDLLPSPKNMYFNYYSTQLMFQCDGPTGQEWNRWNNLIREQLIQAQETEGGKHLEGSWFFPGDSTHHEAESGGRVYHTALATMTLQTYYRYGFHFDQAKDSE